MATCRRSRIFTDRAEAGRLLASQLSAYAGRADAVVLGLPRGGVPVAAEVARSLRLPLDVLVVRKLGAPGQEELAVGAVAEGGIRVVNHRLVRDLGLEQSDLDRIAAREQRELERRVATYRGDSSPLDIMGRTAILVDDGVATGATMRAGLCALRAMGVSKLVAAAPVGSAEAVRALEAEADEVAVMEIPAAFSAVGQWYADFAQTTDGEVRRLLAEGRGGIS